jgi:hypothetical protein
MCHADVLCCAVLCHAMPRGVLGHAKMFVCAKNSHRILRGVICHAVLCCAVLCCAVLCCAVLCCAMQGGVLGQVKQCMLSHCCTLHMCRTCSITFQPPPTPHPPPHPHTPPHTVCRAMLCYAGRCIRSGQAAHAVDSAAPRDGAAADAAVP